MLAVDRGLPTLLVISMHVHRLGMSVKELEGRTRNRSTGLSVEWVVSNTRAMRRHELENMTSEIITANFKKLSLHLSGLTEKNHEHSHSGYEVPIHPIYKYGQLKTVYNLFRI